MKYITKNLDFQLDKRSVVTLGKFDGVHTGHSKLINRVMEIGKEGYETVVFTFDVSPLVKLGTRIKRTILTNEERRILLERRGVDCLVECPFIPEIIQMEPEDFIREILVKQLRAAYVVVGPDFHFGYERKGTPRLLQELGTRYGYEVEILSKETREERPVSSTWIREVLQEGNIEKVNDLLGYRYFVLGEVVHGRLPPFGVYASKTFIKGKTFYGISNVGVKPTVEVPFAGVETYLFDCDEDLYGEEAWVEFYHFVRPECKFDSVEELKAQIQRDANAGKQYFQKRGLHS